MHKIPGTLVLIAALLAPAVGAGGGTELRRAARLLSSRDPAVRRNGLDLLAGRRDRSALLLLLPVLGDRDPEVRAAAARILKGRRTPADLAVVRSRGIKSPEPRVRLACYRHLLRAASPGDDAEDLLEAALTDRDPGVREAAAGLVQRSGGRGPSLLAAAVLRGREGRPRAEALLALARLDPDAARALSPRLLADRAMECRVAALRVLADGSADRARSALLQALDDESWSVRVEAIRRLSALQIPDAVPALIRRLAHERGRVKNEAVAALAALTGVGLPPDAARWERWWKGAKAKFRIPERPAVPAPDPRGSVVTFHSIPLDSDGIAFVLDHSRSMGERVCRKGRSPKADSREGDGRITKGRLVERELTHTLSALRFPARFLLVTFGTEVDLFRDRPVPVGPASRAAALRWYRRLPLRGRTNLFDALARALAEPSVDTIVVLTDGAPSAGEYRTRASILAEVSRLNRYRRAVIHTVNIGGETVGRRWRGFLAELARENGGRHVRR